MSKGGSESVKDTVLVLINALGDTDNSVNNVVIKSLTKIANTFPNEVLQIFCDFYKDTVKISTTQLGNIVKVLEQTCVNQMKRVEKDVALELISAMLRAMTGHVSFEPSVQMGASAVLVAVGHEYLDQVLRSLINQLSPASVPHYTIPHTLGTLAAVNTHGFVPHIKEVLGKMLPMLPMVRQDGVKQAFAYAFGHFAVAVSEHIGDNVENDNITSIKDNFVTEFTVIFDVLYNQWLPSYEPKVSESVLEALGPITRLISERQFNETVNKFILSLLSLYKKPNVNHYYISQCISYLLTASPLNPKLFLSDNVINALNHTLYNLVILEPDYDQPHTVKNHFEILRCFDHMAEQFTEQTIETLLQQCKNNQETHRMRAVIILTHLTTSSQVFIDKYAIKFIAILKVMTEMEQALKMKKLLVKAIVGLVYRNCVTTAEEFTMIEFIIKHSGVEASAASHSEIRDLQDTCKSSLLLMCSTVISVRAQLRDLLLSALTVDEFSPSMPTVCSCLTTLLQNNNSEVATEEKNGKSLEIPKCSPDLIFVRCITNLADPEQREKNKKILLFLEEFSGDVHKNLQSSWTIEIQRLLKYVEKSESNDQWHSMLRDFLTTALDHVNSNKWVETVATLISQQIINRKQLPVIKGISLQYLAILTCHMTNAAVVEKMIKIIILALKGIPIEGCTYVSKAVGIASRQHGEFVMNELDAMYKENESRKSSKLLNFLSARSSKNDAEFSIAKYAIIICYGKVATECLDVHVLARLAENVTAILYDILKSSPPFDLCNASITTLYEISTALLPAAHHNVALRSRWQLLNAVLEQIYNSNLEKRNVELYPVVIKASTALTKLQKGILGEERNTILRVLFNSIFSELSCFKRLFEVEGNTYQNDLLAKTLNDSLNLLHNLIKELIIQSTCLSTIDDLIGLLQEWIQNDNDEIRNAAIVTIQVVFDTYIRNVKLNYETPSKFGQMGYLLGLLIPGIADPNFPVRLITMDCIKLIIQIQDLYEGHTIEPDDVCMNSLIKLQNNVLTNDVNNKIQYCMELCNIIGDKIPHLHTMQFIESLLEGYDEREHRSIAISAVLEAFFMKKGQDLYQNIERIVDIMLKKMDDVKDEALTRLIQPLSTLTRYHSNAVTAVLLAQKIPLKPSVMACWRSLARDEDRATAIVDNFLRLMNSIELYEDPYHITDRHIAALQPLTLISALGEMLQEPAMKSTVQAKFSDIFTILFTTLACYIEAEPPAYSVPQNKMQERLGFVPNREAMKLSPAKIVAGSLNAFFERAECKKIREACTICLSGDYFPPHLVIELSSFLSSELLEQCPQHVSTLVSRLSSVATSTLPPKRAAAHALLTQLLKYRCNNNPVLIETVLATLKTGLKDESPRVRCICLRGAANVASLNIEHRTHVLPMVIHALSQGIDATSNESSLDNVPLASIQSLKRLIIEVDRLDKDFERELLAIAQKIRPFMNTACPGLRENSIKLFGVIAGRLKNETIVEQSISSLPCFLLHLCDPDSDVVMASKITLRQIFETFGIKKSNDFVQTHLVDEGRLYLDEFLSALLRQLADELPGCVVKCIQSAVNYLHGAREEMKPHPPLLVGLLYGELYRIRDKYPENTEIDEEITQTARTRLLFLIKDPNPNVRQHSAAALANICLLNGLKE